MLPLTEGIITPSPSSEPRRRLIVCRVQQNAGETVAREQGRRGSLKSEATLAALSHCFGDDLCHVACFFVAVRVQLHSTRCLVWVSVQEILWEIVMRA